MKAVTVPTVPQAACRKWKVPRKISVKAASILIFKESVQLHAVQQNGELRYFSHKLRGFLDGHFPEKWIASLLAVSLARPDSSFSVLWGCIKDAVYVAPLATTLPNSLNG